MAGEGFEAELAAYLRSLRENPGGAVPPSGPGESFTVFSLPEFPHEIPYIAVTEQRTYPIRHAPTLEPMTFSGLADDEVILYLPFLSPVCFVVITAFQFPSQVI